MSSDSNVSLNSSIFTDPRTGSQYNVVVQLDEPSRTTSEDLSRLFVMGEGGRPVLLGAVAEVKPGVGPVMSERKYQQRLIKINAQPAADRDLGAIAQDIEDKLTRYVMLEERFPRRMEDPAQLSLQAETA